VLNAQTSDWQEVRFKARDVWKSTTMEVGEQFVTTTLETLKPESFASVWDMGWCKFSFKMYRQIIPQVTELVVYNIARHRNTRV